MTFTSRFAHTAFLIAFVVAIGLALFALMPLVAHAGGAPDEFEARVRAELEERAPNSIDLYERAEAARGAGDFETARELYGTLVERVPEFDHAERRLCHVDAMLGNHASAIKLCRQARKHRESPENLAALAMAIAARRPTQEAASLARKAVRLDPTSTTAYGVQCSIAIELDDLSTLRRCSERLIELAPDEVAGHFYAAVVAGSGERWDDARRHLDRAHALGLSDDVHDDVLASIDDMEPMWPEILRAAGIAVAVWAVLMVLLIIVGGILSRMTMRAATRVTQTDAREPVHAAGATLRAVYQNVLRLSCVIYYASLPLLVGVIALTGGGLVYAFFAAGRVPIKLVLVIGVVTIASMFAVIKSVFVRVRDDDPGTRLDLREHPKLRAALDEVAARIDTRPVDNVYVTPGTDIAVMERGGMYAQLRGTSERCLILGLGVLEDMPLPAFKAILAHEYGHFSNRDTAGGGLALAVRRSLLAIGINLAESGAAAWYNPAWLFFRAFYRVFQGISQGASRLQEIMADRWAVLAYGASHFETGLRHAIRRSLVFDAHIGNTLDEVVEKRTRLTNLYVYEPEQKPTAEEIDAAIEDAIHRAPSPYDSHPRPADRFRWAHAMGAPAPTDADPAADAWSLLEKRYQLEHQMTDEIRSAVAANHGIEI